MIHGQYKFGENAYLAFSDINLCRGDRCIKIDPVRLVPQRQPDLQDTPQSDGACKSVKIRLTEFDHFFNGSSLFSRYRSDTVNAES